MPESKTSPRRIQARLRAKQALELRLVGATFQQIAQRLGYNSKVAAYKAVMGELDRIPKPEAEELLKVNLERLNKGRMAVWPLESHKDVETELKIQAREAAYLGLDSPTKLEHGADEERPIRVVIERVARDDGAPAPASGAGADTDLGGQGGAHPGGRA